MPKSPEDIHFFAFGSMPVLAYFRTTNFDPMAQKKNNGAYWLLFLVSAAGFALAIATHFEYLTLILPFLFTSFVKAMDIM
jgi:hypothetical protein